MNNQKESKLSFKNIFQRETKLATYIIVCCTILVLGISYAVFFQVNQNSNNQVVEAGDLTFTYQDGNQITSSSKSSCFEPMSDDEAGLYSSNCAYQFSVQNTGTLMGSYTLTLTANSANTAPADQVKVILKRQNAEGILETVEGYPKKVSEITNGILLENGEINVGESIVYSIQIYVDESTVTDPNVDSGTAYNIDYMINGTATVHESQDISTEPPAPTAVDKIKEIAVSNPEQLVYDETSDNNLRYIGADPSNYVSFNGELWRIIGVMNNIDDGTGNKETRLKIIRNESIGEYSWDYDGTASSDKYNNDWSTSTLMNLLNNGAYYNRTTGSYYNNSTEAITVDFSSNGLTSEAKSMISNAVWNLGGTTNYKSDTDGLASHFYGYERGTEVASGRPTEWTGQVGLIYPSDYGYATSGGSTTDRTTCLSKALYSWDSLSYSDCKNNAWIYKSGIHQWTLTPYLGFDSSLFYVLNDGSMGSPSPTAAPVPDPVFPVTYLSSNVKITGGDGSHDNPYTLSL